jgi:hypothetical protein
MKLGDIATTLGLQCLTPELDTSQREITSGYVSDLLSDVLAHASGGGVLVTVQVHLNVIAVAVHADLAAVFFALGREPEPAVKAKAIEEGVALYGSKEPAFELVGHLYTLGVRGTGT